MRKNKAVGLSKKAFDELESLLDDKRTPRTLKFKVCQDILDRGGYPKYSATSIQNTTKVLTGADLKQEREELLAEFKEVKKEIRQLEEGKIDGKRDEPVSDVKNSNVRAENDTVGQPIEGAREVSCA